MFEHIRWDSHSRTQKMGQLHQEKVDNMIDYIQTQQMGELH